MIELISSANINDIKVFEMRDLGDELLLLFVIPFVILKNDQVKLIIKIVAVLVAHQIMILVWFEDALEVGFLFPLLRVEYLVGRELCRVIELYLKVGGEIAAVQHESVTCTAGID